MQIRQLLTALVLGGCATSVFALEERVTEEFPLKEGGTVRVENINGDITVETIGGNTVEMEALKVAKSQEILDGMQILTDTRDGDVNIDTKLHKKETFWGGDNNYGKVHYTLRVPDYAHIRTDSVNGDLMITAGYGKVHAETVNGDMELINIQSDLNIDTVNGDADVHFAKLDGDQSLKAESVNGDFSFEFPGNASAEVEIETLNGSIRTGDFKLHVHEGKYVGRDVREDIGGGDARVRIETVNGDIRIERQ